MPNVDKIVKNVMHEISDGKVAVRETMNAALRNQEIIIAQNKRVVNLLEQICSSISQKRDADTAESAFVSTPLQSALVMEDDEDTLIR